MTCTNPFRMKDKEGGILELPCGHCTACRIARAREWASRLVHEMGYYNKSTFITLTYDKEHLPLDGSINKDDLQKFFKRLRKNFPPKSLKYFACGEYGDDHDRPHYHAIIFGIGCSRSDKDLIRDTWSMGRTSNGTVTFNSCRYVTDYVLKKYDGKKAHETYGNRKVPFCLMSKGLGLKYVQQNEKQLTENGGFTIQGTPVGLPRYYISKLPNLDKQQLRENAIKRSKEILQTFRERGQIVDDDFQWTFMETKKQSRQQAETNLNAKNLLYKGKL